MYSATREAVEPLAHPHESATLMPLCCSDVAAAGGRRQLHNKQQEQQQEPM